MTDFQTKIKQHYTELSKSARKVAEVLLENPKSFAVKTAGQIGEEIGVSETTVIRFTYALGYSGFSELQKEIREYFFEMKSSLDNYQQGKQNIKDSEHFYAQVMNQDQENIMRTASSISTEDFNIAVEKLTAANRVLAAGMRSSHAMAHWFVYALDIIKGNIRLFRPETDDVILRLSELDEQSVFVGFSFHRYTPGTLKLAKVLKEKGVFIIGVTDSPVAPICEYSDVTLSVNLKAKSTLDAAPACFSLLNSLCSAVSLNMPENFEKRRRDYESYHLASFFQKE